MNSKTSSHNITTRTGVTAALSIADKVKVVSLTSTPINLALVVLGALITIFAYSSMLPILAIGALYGVTYMLLLLPVLGGVYERNIFNRVFAVGFVMAGVAAIYANYFQDEAQLFSDAGSFFELAAGRASGLSLSDLRVISEGSLAIVVWGAVYDFFAALGFSRERHIGISINVVAVALSGVMALKIARLTYGEDTYRFKRLTLLFSCCGLFWLFAGIHLRDSVVLLAVTILVFVWLDFLKKPNIGWGLIQLLSLNFLATVFFEYLREEFLLVPLAMGIAGLATLMVGLKTQRSLITIFFLILVVSVALSGALLTSMDSIESALFGGRESYQNLALDEHSADSIGMSLIVNQPIALRLPLGAMYLLVFPIPFWSGFQLNTASLLFKSLNALFFYFLIPLLVLTMRELWRNREKRTPATVFTFFVFAGFTLAVAGTSLETRHFGAFLAPLFVLVLLPDLRVLAVRQYFQKVLIVVLGGVAMVHIAWIFLKFA